MIVSLAGLAILTAQDLRKSKIVSKIVEIVCRRSLKERLELKLPQYKWKLAIACKIPGYCSDRDIAGTGPIFPGRLATMHLRVGTQRMISN